MKGRAKLPNFINNGREGEGKFDGINGRGKGKFG
jgi:hypothetical protein